MAASSKVFIILLSLSGPLFATIAEEHEANDFAFDAEDSELNSTTFFVVQGKLFHLDISNILKNSSDKCQVKQSDGRSLPSWLIYTPHRQVLVGVPIEADPQPVHITISCSNAQSRYVRYTIQVVNSRSGAVQSQFNDGACSPDEDPTVLVLIIDRKLNRIEPTDRILTLVNISKHLTLPLNDFTLMSPLDAPDSAILMSVRAANSKSDRKFGYERQHKMHKWMGRSLLRINIGCGGSIRPHAINIVRQLKRQVKDGTIAEVLDLPLFGWRIEQETKLSPKAKVIQRQRRNADEVDGSGDAEYYDEYDEEDAAYDDEDDEDDVPDPNTTRRPTTTTLQVHSSTTPSTTLPTTATSTTLRALPSSTSLHPHRHHHGEEKSLAGDLETTKSIPSTSTATTIKLPSISSTTKSTHPIVELTTKNASLYPVLPADYDDYGIDDDDDEDGDVDDDDATKTITLSTSTISTNRPQEFTPRPIDEVITYKKPTTTTTHANPIETTTGDEETTTGNILETTALDNIIVEDTENSVVTISEDVVTTEGAEEAISSTTENYIPAVVTLPIPSPPRTTSTPTSKATTTAWIITTEMIPNVTFAEITSNKIFYQNNTGTTFRIPLLNTEPTTVRYSYGRQNNLWTSTERITYNVKNSDPYIENRLPQLSVQAGKIFRYVIPINTFKDLEDGYNLTLQVLNVKEEPLNVTSWCHFNALRREIYGLPLEEDISKWEYIVRATDHNGSFISDRLTIHVQQHKSHRIVNHEFTLQLRIEKPSEFAYTVDWCLKVLRALGRIYNTNMSEITVRNVNASLFSDLAHFVWTNDTMLTAGSNYCPRAEIGALYKRLTANDHGDPSRELNLAMGPELRIKKVTYKGLGVCHQPHIPSPVTPPTNFRPFLRNPVDHVNATVGEMLIFRVPDDTFYDPEDTDSRVLNITLLTGDRHPIPAHNWLQFDHKNREFYGIPRKPGRSEYQLVCVDSAGLPATDSLEVVVYPAPQKLEYNAEFSMTLEMVFDVFVNSASLQRKFAEKLLAIFDDSNMSALYFGPFKAKHNGDATIVTWYNRSLAGPICPKEEIFRLESKLRNRVHNNQSISSNVRQAMEPDFHIANIKVLPLDNCHIVHPPKVPPTISPPRKGMAKAHGVPPSSVHHHESTGNGPASTTTTNTSNDDYLFTFIIPAVIIAVMLCLATVVACVLYRRRRTGKMNVLMGAGSVANGELGTMLVGGGGGGGNSGKRATALISVPVEPNGRHKGIPVIFQEELDERPDPGTKTPIILKEERPPLAPPPDYTASTTTNSSSRSTVKLPFNQPMDASRPLMGLQSQQTPGHGGVAPSIPPHADSEMPYQPPPPFTRAQDVHSHQPHNITHHPHSNFSGSGKSPQSPSTTTGTPSYRKPPPYVSP